MITNKKESAANDSSLEDIEAIMNELGLTIDSLDSSKINSVQDIATRSEEMVREITQDIQQLDQAKRNLTLSITTLNNIVLIVSAIDKLNELLGLATNESEDDDKAEHTNPFSKQKGISYIIPHRQPIAKEYHIKSCFVILF
ncbi:unnamed protein product [Protopolystoma xenopodis]|uniref:Vps53 N-terminal domain-containing protein n=1 Tax=Protopolystoma xenopodis TaxID=117903 RepID=A0A3S5A255_9PLAT|nr:unnamed protein product [Protopolystoma xenopodis]